MKDVEFIGEEELSFRKPKKWSQQIKSDVVNWMIKHNFAKTETQAITIVILGVILIFITAAAIFFLAPPAYTPPPPPTPSGLIKMP